MLKLDSFSDVQVVEAPFRHLLGAGLIDETQAEALAKDFPNPSKAGFLPVEELEAGPTFDALIKELRSTEFSKKVGDALGRDLTRHPQMIVVRRWSAKKDGRPHTDGPDKVATALLYLNESWDNSSGGALRYLEGPDLNGPGGPRISAVFGAFTAFLRSDSSWHGHHPFEGERRVVQVFWVKDEEALGRKRERHKRTAFWKNLSGLVKGKAAS